MKLPFVNTKGVICIQLDSTPITVIRKNYNFLLKYNPLTELFHFEVQIVVIYPTQRNTPNAQANPFLPTTVKTFNVHKIASDNPSLHNHTSIIWSTPFPWSRLYLSLSRDREDTENEVFMEYNAAEFKRLPSWIFTENMWLVPGHHHCPRPMNFGPRGKMP